MMVPFVLSISAIQKTTRTTTGKAQHITKHQDVAPMLSSTFFYAPKYEAAAIAKCQCPSKKYQRQLPVLYNKASWNWDDTFLTITPQNNTKITKKKVSSHCLQITQNVALEIFNFGIFHQFCHVWQHCLTASFRFSKTCQNEPFWHF